MIIVTLVKELLLTFSVKNILKTYWKKVFFSNLAGNTAPNPPNCPITPVSVTTIPGATSATATYGPFTCTDAEQGAIVAQCNPMSGSQFSVGSNGVTCTCTDNGGLQNACTFVVTVTGIWSFFVLLSVHCNFFSRKDAFTRDVGFYFVGTSVRCYKNFRLCCDTIMGTSN